MGVNLVVLRSLLWFCTIFTQFCLQGSFVFLEKTSFFSRMSTWRQAYQSYICFLWSSLSPNLHGFGKLPRGRWIFRMWPFVLIMRIDSCWCGSWREQICGNYDQTELSLCIFFCRNCVFQRRWVRFDGDSLAYYNNDKVSAETQAITAVKAENGMSSFQKQSNTVLLLLTLAKPFSPIRKLCAESSKAKS